MNIIPQFGNSPKIIDTKLPITNPASSYYRKKRLSSELIYNANDAEEMFNNYSKKLKISSSSYSIPYKKSLKINTINLEDYSCPNSLNRNM